MLLTDIDVEPLDMQAANPVRGRYDALIKGNLLPLVTQISIELRDVLSDFLIRATIDAACHFGLRRPIVQNFILLFQIGDVSARGLSFAKCCEDTVSGLITTQLVRAVNKR